MGAASRPGHSAGEGKAVVGFLHRVAVSFNVSYQTFDPVSQLLSLIHDLSERFEGPRNIPSQLGISTTTTETPTVEATNATQPEPLRAIDLAGCITEEIEPVPWVVPGWLAEGDVAVLAGEPKTGKSWLALTLAFDVASGGRWLDALDVTGDPRPVMVVDEENNPRLIRYRVRKLAHARGLSGPELAELPIRYLSQNALNLDDPDRLRAFWAEVTAFKPSFVVFDSLVRFHRRDENSNTAVAGFFGDVVRPLTAHFDCGALILHHMAKPGQMKTDLVNRIRGAGDIVAVADQVWTLERRGDEGATLRHERSRWAETASDLLVRIEDTEDGQGVLVTSEDAEDGAEDVIRAVLNEAAGTGALRQEIIDAVIAAGHSKRVGTKHLGQMNHVNRVKKCREGNAVRYWMSEFAPLERIEGLGTGRER